MATYTPSTNIDPNKARYGDQGSGVLELQKMLNARGANLALDSKYGALTQAAYNKYFSSTPNVQTNPTISANDINTQPFRLPPSPTYESLLGDLGIDVAGAQAERTRAEETQGKGMSDLQLLQRSLLGEYADTVSAENAQGLPQLSSDLRDLQAMSQSQTARYLQGYTQAEQQNIPMSFIRNQQQEMTRQHGIDALVTNSLISAKQGKIETAQAQVDRAVAMKYNPIKQQLQNTLDFLNLNKDVLSRADKKLADAKEKQLNLQLRQVEKKEQDEKEIRGIALEAAKNGASASTLAKIQEAGSINGAMRAASGYFRDPLDVQLKRLQIQKAQADLGGGGGKDQKIVKINGVDYLQNSDGTFSLPVIPKSPQSAAAQQATQDKIALTQSLKTHKGLSQTVGSTGIFGRGGTISPGRRQDFIASVEQLRGQLTLENLINAKAQGATFGALSDGELQLLASAASKIGTWAIKNDDGRVTGYKVGERAFRKELNTIENLMARSLVNSNNTDAYLDSVDSILEAENNPYSQAGYIIQ